VIILTTLGTQDEKWVQEAVSKFDRKNINYISIKNYDKI
jgi:hypothetical protein